MWRVLLADDEVVIVKGLGRLIDWAALQIEIVGEATDGAMAAQMIEELEPDLVISDIRMPEMTGLELMERTGAHGPKFIFISGYEEFSYARKALAGGAVDYLLKPVSAEALEQAVRRALSLMEESTAAALLRDKSGQMEDFFSLLNENRAFSGSELNRRFMEMIEGRSSPVFAGLCFGLTPEEEVRLGQLSYERRLLQRFMALNTLRDMLERAGAACFLRKEESCCFLMGIFQSAEEIEAVLHGMLETVAQRTGYQVRVGVGRPRSVISELAATYEEAGIAFDLYYFEERDYICFGGSEAAPVYTNEDFDAAVKAVYYDIVGKRESVPANIDLVLEIIWDLHYGNRSAAFNRALVFTGDLLQMLFASGLLTGSFAQRQDALQHSLERCCSFRALRNRIHEYYHELLPHVYDTAREKNTAEIARVQKYIEEHYAEELSLKLLAEVACVSPNYFSAYFKGETGQNYKAYLTRVRMEQAMKLVLGSDLKTYEIAEQVGYHNVRRFVDSFRAAYEISPMDYRRLHRK